MLRGLTVSNVVWQPADDGAKWHRDHRDKRSGRLYFNVLFKPNKPDKQKEWARSIIFEIWIYPFPSMISVGFDFQGKNIIPQIQPNLPPRESQMNTNNDLLINSSWEHHLILSPIFSIKWDGLTQKLIRRIFPMTSVTFERFLDILPISHERLVKTWTVYTHTHTHTHTLSLSHTDTHTDTHWHTILAKAGYVGQS